MELRKVKGINFIRVRGTQFERAVAHIKLLRNEVNAGVIPALAKKNEILIRRGAGFLQNPAIQKIVQNFYKNIFMKLLDGSLSAEERSMIRAISAEAGLSYETMRNALYQPDAMMVLAKIAMIRYLLPEWIPGGFQAVAVL